MSMQYVACHDRDLFVHLSAREIDDAIRHGAKMRRTSLARGHEDHKGYGFRPPTDEKALRTQCLGALCEAVIRASLCFEVPLSSETYNVADLPDQIQVRLIGEPHYGLRVYPQDEDHWKVVGVVIPRGLERVSPYRVPGWIEAYRAKWNDDWLIAPHGGPALWAVPQQVLNDLRDIGGTDGRMF